MKQYATITLLLCAIGAAYFALHGDGSYERMQALKNAVEVQKEINEALQTKVYNLQARVKSLKLDGREIEKAAREEFNLARQDELIYVFEEDKGK